LTGDNYLLDAIDALTLPRKVTFVQPDPGGSAIECVSTVEHEAPLEKLRDSIGGGTGSHAGSSDPRTRIPIDPVAMSLYSRIEDRVGEWCMDSGIVPGVLPEGNLREWYRAHINEARIQADPARQLVVEAQEAEVTRQVSSWLRQITDMFDPPKRMEITRRVQVPLVNPKSGEHLYWPDGSLRVRLSTRPAHCPLCDQATAFDPSTGDQITALIIEYRQSQEEAALRAGVARCRSCESMWTGDAGIRQLRQRIDEWEEDHPAV
jgi:hypothetical protein